MTATNLPAVVKAVRTRARQPECPRTRRSTPSAQALRLGVAKVKNIDNQVQALAKPEETGGRNRLRVARAL